jgi:ferritin
VLDNEGGDNEKEVAMKLTPKIETLLNRQLNCEYAASHAYLGMSAIFESDAYTGFGAWMRRQSAEEHTHMMKFYQYILDRGGEVKLSDIAATKVEDRSVLGLVTLALKQEQQVTANIYALVTASQKAGDYATVNFLQWFLEEQVEEEATMSELIQKVSRVANDEAALMIMDKEMADKA